MKRIHSFLVLALFAAVACQKPCPPVESTPKVETPTPAPYPEEISFLSLDSLTITAHLYPIDTTSPVILLCHQARYNKFEYAGIAEKLNELGFNCLAIDQRSGGPIGNQTNTTTQRALAANKPIAFVDAEQDMLAAINFLYEKYNQPVVLWGSSYSSTLALYIGAENDQVKAVVSFSPGNYLAEQKGDLPSLLKEFSKPMFVTSSKREAKGVTELLSQMTFNDTQIHFIPNGNGHHGSRALWPTQSDGEEYWNAITAFLQQLKTAE